MIYRFSSSLKKVFFSWRVDVGRGQRSSVTFSHRVEKNNRVTILPFKSGRFLFFFSFLLFFFSANFYGEKSNAIPGQVITFPPVYVMARLNSDSYKFETNNFITQVLQSGSIFFFFLLFCDTFVITVFGRLFYKLNIAYKR